MNLVDSHKLFDRKTLVDLGKGGELLPRPLDHNENKQNIGGLLKKAASQEMNIDTFISKLNSTEISEKATVGARRFIQLFYKTSYEFSKQNYKIK